MTSKLSLALLSSLAAVVSFPVHKRSTDMHRCVCELNVLELNINIMKCIYAHQNTSIEFNGLRMCLPLFHAEATLAIDAML